MCGGGDKNPVGMNRDLFHCELKIYTMYTYVLMHVYVCMCMCMCAYMYIFLALSSESKDTPIIIRSKHT